MGAQDIRNLQEAYVEVYERISHDGSFHRDSQETDPSSNPELPPDMQLWRRRRPAMTYAERQSREENKTPKEIEAERKKRQELAQNFLSGPQQEQVDLYNIILSHLLDEGYADTPEAAEAIMVNMSEEWRNSIIN